MRPGTRRLVLAVHLAVSVGWIGAAAAYVALGVAAQASTATETVRGAWVAMEIVGWYVIVPLALATLATGVVIAVGSRWGLFRHWWVVFSLALTLFAVAVLLLHMPTVSETAAIARRAEPAHVRTLGGDVGHPAIGLGVLLLVMALNIWKPQGLTAHGRRTERERRGRRRP